MKKVLLYISAALGMAGVFMAAYFLRSAYYIQSHSSVHTLIGYDAAWQLAIVRVLNYFLALAIYYLSLRGLKKRDAKGLWSYMAVAFLLVGVMLARMTTYPWSWSMRLEIYSWAFLLLPLLLPLYALHLSREGRLMGVALLGVLVLSLGAMTVSWYRYEDWNSYKMLDLQEETDKVFISDAYSKATNGMMLTVDEEGNAYAYVSLYKYTYTEGQPLPTGDVRLPTEVFSVRREGNEFVFYKDFYEDENQDQPVLSIPCLRGHIWDDYESAYCVRMTYQENPLFTKDKQSGIYCHLEYTDRPDVGADDPLAGRRPEDWPGEEWDVLDERFVVGEDHRLSNESGMVLLWTYTDDRFILAKKQEGPEGVTYEPLACGRKQAGRGVYDVKNIGTGVWWNGMDDFVYTDHDSQNRGVIWPGEPLKDVREARLKDGWQEVPLRDEYASSLCLFEKDGKRTALFIAEADDAYSWADRSDEFDPREQLVTGYALLAPDGTVEAYGGLALVATDQIEPLLAQLDTRSKIGSFGYIDWQACWPSRARLTADGRLILRDKAGEWMLMALSDLIER